MVNSRDIAGNAEQGKEKKKELYILPHLSDGTKGQAGRGSHPVTGD